MSIPAAVRVPVELHSCPARVLEDYVRARISQFGSVLARRLTPGLTSGSANAVVSDTLRALPPPDYSGLSLAHRDLQLVFRHDCLSLGCLDAQCVLCEHNPHRRCCVNFSSKYLVNDVLKAKCEAPIRVEVIDRATGQPVGDALGELALELCILDGNAYDTRCGEGGGETDAEELAACALVLNNKASPLLLCGPGATHDAQARVTLPLGGGSSALPELHVSDSSEAMLSGRKPPFRLLARAVASGRKEEAGREAEALKIRHAVSEGFVVATRRTRTAGKVEIPNVDDHVSKLEHMGKETVKKLQDIHGSALAVGVDLQVAENAVHRVGEFRRLSLLAEADGHLRQKLQQVLKLSKEKWDEARDHALKAVVADSRMRIWYADQGSRSLGLLFTCRLGNVDLERPVGLLSRGAQEAGGLTTMEATLMAQQTPAQRDQVRALQPAGVAAWWQSGHPGWAIYPVDSERFLSTGALDVGAPEQAGPAAPDEGSRQGGGYAAAPRAYHEGVPPYLMGPGRAPEPLLGPLLPPGGPGNALSALGSPPAGLSPPPLAHLPALPPRPAAAAEAGRRAEQREEGGAEGSGRGDTPFGALAAPGSGAPASPAGAAATPFGLAQAQAAGCERSLPGGAASAGSFAPSASHVLTMSSLQNLFGSDLSKLPGLASGLSLGQVPPVPGMMSDDLEQLLQAHVGGGDALFPGHSALLAAGKLESLDLPDGLHGPLRAPRLSAFAARANSGLENMQSIEKALNDVHDHGAGAHAAIEAAAQEYVRAQLSGHKRASSRPLS